MFMETKNRNYLLIILTLVVLFIGCPIALSQYVINGDLNFNLNEIECSENNIGERNYVEFDYNDGFTDSYYFYTNNNTVIINESSIPTPEDRYNHKFDGWYFTKSGYNTDGTSSRITFPHNFKIGTKVYAKYLSTEPISSTINGNTYIDKGTTNYYYINSSNTEISKEINITTGGYLSIRYGSGKEFSENDSGTDYSVKYISEADVVAVLDSDIIIDGGTLQLNSIIGSTVKQGIANQLSGSFTALDLNGYTITIMNNGNLNGYGIIYNSQESGGIIVYDGTLTSIFTPIDFKGGGNTCLNYVSNLMEFGGFFCPYITCEILFTKYSTFKCYTSLNASSEKHSTTILLISGTDTNTLFYLSDGYIIKQTTDYLSYQQEFIQYNAQYNTTTSADQYFSSFFREKIIFTNNPSQYLKSIYGIELVTFDKCNVTLNNIAMHISLDAKITTIEVDVSLKYTDFPIPSFYDIILNNTDINIPISLVAMPGSTVDIDENSTVYFTNQSDSNVGYIFGRLTVLDNIKNDLFFLNNGSKKSSQIWFYNNLMITWKPAVVNMNGLFKFNQTNVNFSNNYTYYTLGGRINLNDQALNSLREYSSYFYLQNKFFYPDYVAKSLTAGSAYSYFPAYYFSQPLLSNGKAYLQTSLGGDIIECDYVDEVNDIYGNSENYYFLKYSKSGYGKTAATTSFMSNNTPKTDTLIEKHNSTDGLFTTCTPTYFNYGFSNKKTVCIISDNQKYILTSGAYIKATSEITVDSYKRLSNVSVASDNKFVVSNTSSDFTYSQTSTTLYFDYTTDSWRFYYA